MKVARVSYLCKIFFRIILVFIILGFIFAIHEYGHLKESQNKGIPIKEFSLGAGPVLFQYQTDSSMIISLRLIPLMAYVEASKEERKLFDDRASFLDKTAIDIAGVKNNLFVGVVAVIFLQILGWKRGNISTSELVKTIITTPINVILRFVAFLVGCFTFGRIDFAERFLLSTGNIKPSRTLRFFIIVNIVLGYSNLIPILPLDGGRILKEAMLLVGADTCVDLFKSVSVALFIVFFLISGVPDIRVLKIEKKKITIKAPKDKSL